MPAPEQDRLPGAVVNGFTGSSIWHCIYAFPPTDQKYWQQGFRRFRQALDADPRRVREGKTSTSAWKSTRPRSPSTSPPPSARSKRSKGHKRFGFNYDPSHLGYQGVDYVKFIRTFGDRIFHVHMKDVWWGHGDGTVGVFGGHTNFADPRRYWDFRSLGHGDINFEEIIVALNDVGYTGPAVGRVGRQPHGPRARRHRGRGVREEDRLQPRSDIAFDAQFDR